MTEHDPLVLAILLSRILDSLGIRYVVGGSVASGLLGEPRTTYDLDLMIELDESSAKRLVVALEPEFYVEESMVLDAVRRASSFNIIHYGTATKVDLFVREDAPFAIRQLDRALMLEIEPGTLIRFYTPEDLVVRKLSWFQAGAGISDRQWRDVVGLLKVNAELDLSYTRALAVDRGVSMLLERALVEAGRDDSVRDQGSKK